MSRKLQRIGNVALAAPPQIGHRQRLDTPDQNLEPLQRQRRQQGITVGEMTVGRVMRNPGASCDFTQADRRHTHLGE